MRFPIRSDPGSCAANIRRKKARHRGDAGLLKVLYAKIDSVVRELLGGQRGLCGGQLGDGDSAR